MILLILLALFFYTLSVYATYKVLKKAYQKEHGDLELSAPDAVDIVLVFLPIFNILVLLVYSDTRELARKFFRLEK